ncbi:MAG TPA: class I SAM-dependent methyltransferase [Chloroflexia bacterium]|jgi:SAM-dependent methyltransferase|nr:class I SAM-dependent methyltransferase [Chloroflexia bacterium]
MSSISDQVYLLSSQYKTAANLNARIRLHELYSTNKYGWFRWLFDQLDLPAQAAVLEVGCGPGTLWVENLARVPEGWEVTLTDLSPGMVEEARANLQGRERGFNFRQADAMSIPYPDDTFDAVMAMYMLYHVPNRGKALAEMRRVLKPDGKLYVATLGRMHMYEVYELLNRFDAQAAARLPFGPPGLHAQEHRLGFILETAGEEIAQHFSQVKLLRYEDALEVTEAAPLVDYILSSSGSVFDQEQTQALAAFIQVELDAKGHIHIRKDNGLFVVGQ